MNTIEVKLALVSFKIITPSTRKEIYSKVIDKMVSELNGLDIECKINNLCLQFQMEICSDKELVEKLFPECRMHSYVFIIKSKSDINPFIRKRTEEYKQAFSDEKEDKDFDWTNSCLRDLADYIEKYIYDIMLGINITYPGLFQIASGEINIINTYYLRINNINNNLVDVYEDWLDKEWPDLVELSFKDTWKWICKNTNYLDGICDSPIDRALNALSYSFNSNNYEDLFYTLLGIEALYNTNKSEGIIEQIKTKIKCMFGEPVKFKKDINNMYSIRSLFVHGKLNFPSKFQIDLYDEGFYDKSYVPTVTIAHSILLATLRKLIKQNASEMVFTTILTLK